VNEQIKITAKIQYFYDLVISRLDEYESIGVSSKADTERLIYKEKAKELNSILCEFSKTFDAFLYKHE